MQTQIHLDAAEFITAGTYNSADNTTAVSWPNYVSYGTNTTDIYWTYAVDADTGEMFRAKSRTGSDFVFHGNFAGKAIVIGLAIGAGIEFPIIYVRQTSGNKTTSDVTASLIVQRVHYYFQHVSNVDLYQVVPGPVSTSYKLIEFSDTNIAPINRYESDKPLGDSPVTLTIPYYQRNTNVSPLLLDNSPGPFSLTSITWEGDYTPMNHKRV